MSRLKIIQEKFYRGDGTGDVTSEDIDWLIDHLNLGISAVKTALRVEPTWREMILQKFLDEIEKE